MSEKGFSLSFPLEILHFYKNTGVWGFWPLLPWQREGTRLGRMSFVRRITTGEERIIMIARLHWIYPLIGLLWFAGAVCVGIVADRMIWRYTRHDSVVEELTLLGWPVDFVVSAPFTWLFGAGGAVFFLSLALRWASTEIGLTSKRIVYKTGFFMVEVEEVDLEEIKAEQVHHGIFGYVLGYGRVKIDCRFVADLRLPAIRNPYRLVKTINMIREKLRRGGPPEEVP